VSRLIGLALIAGLVVCTRAGAQVVTDGSLGPAGVVPPGLLPDGRTATYRIDEALGQRRGQNLFHSFSSFDLLSSESAAFTADLPTRRVLARVTGGAASSINGALWNTIDGADLYLLNPAGVVFGPNASLDLRGSLYVSSADSLRMSDGTTFPAIPVQGEVLSVAPPSAFGFASDDFGLVRFNRAVNLSVPDGRTLSITAGDVTISGSPLGNTLRAGGGSIEIATRKSAGEIPVEIEKFDVAGAAPGDLGRIQLSSNARLSVADPVSGSPQRGRIVIRGGALVMDGAQLLASSAASASAGVPDIDVATSESVTLQGGSVIQTVASGAATGGDVRIDSPAFDLTAGARVESRAFDDSIGGGIRIAASGAQLSGGASVAASANGLATAGRIALAADSVALMEFAQVRSQNASERDANEVAIDADRLALSGGAGVVSTSDASGAGAALRIRAGVLQQSSGARIESRTGDVGRGGAIEIRADEVALHGASDSVDPGGVFATAFGSGDAGNVLVMAGSLVIDGGAQLSATTLGAGAGGDVRIDAGDEIQISGIALSGPSGIFARSGLDPLTLATGNGGNVSLRARTLSVSNGAEISASSFSPGSAGGVSIDARDSVSVSGAGALRGSINAKTTEGVGGDIEIHTRDLRVRNGGEISVSTLGRGASGDVAIDARRVFVGAGGTSALEPAGIFAQSIPQTGEFADPGDGGSISIHAAKKLELRDGGLISVKTRGLGDAGDVLIQGTDLVRIADGEISARSEGPGRAGSVTLQDVGVLRVGSAGSITTETLADGPGGAIAVDANREVVVANGGAISARSDGTGDAGSISIDAGQQFTARDGGRVTTEANAASGGSILIRARHLLYVRDGEITTSVAGGSENGGNITLDPQFVVLDHANVVARAVAGNGGNILIQTNQFVPDDSSVVDASSQLGVDGEIVITSPGIDLTSELAPLDDRFLDESSQLARTCAARSVKRGTFQVRGTAPSVSPDAPLATPGEADTDVGCAEPQR
jgi:filamentous hemagglutinin family protein